MNLDSLTLGEIKQLQASLGGAKTNDDSHWHVGEAYFIRTVTHHLCGKLIKVTPHEIVLLDAAWVADDGRFSEALRTGDVAEAEPYPDGAEVIIGRGSLIDAVRWPHALLRVVK